MGTHEWETGDAVIEFSVLPTGRVMTRRTDCSKLTVVGIIFRVASHTFLWCTFIHTVHMAGNTLDANMCARQWKARLSMLKVNILPRNRVVAGTAICSKLAVVGILRSMTCKTICRCTFIFAVGMAGGTGCGLVASNQLETSQTVIEIHILPVRWVMTFGTVHAHLPLMNIQMARSTST